MIAEAVQRGQDEAWLSELLAEMQADSATPVLDGWCREMNRASRLTIDPDTVASRPQLRSPGPTDWGALLDGLTNVVGAQLRHPGAAKRWCNAAADYPDPRVRIQVLAALVRQLESATQGGSNSSLDHSMVRDLLLGRLAGDADPMVRAGAAQGLAKLTKSDMALEALRAALHDVHAYVRLFSAESLHDLQETDGLDADLKGAIVSALTSELESLDLPWRLRAARLVVSLDARRFPAVWPALEEGITVTEDATSLQIIEWAGEQGPAAEPAIGILVQATRMAADQRKLTVLPMLDALPKIGGPLQDRRVEELLLDLAADERFPWRRHAVVSLKVFARASPRTVAGLMTALRDRSPVVRQAAAEALAEAGPDAGPVLRQALNDEEAAVQDTARESLRRLGTAP
jgi:HEAT repeat protein